MSCISVNGNSYFESTLHKMNETLNRVVATIDSMGDAMGEFIVMLSFNNDKRHFFYRLIVVLFLVFTIPYNASAEEMIGKG